MPRVRANDIELYYESQGAGKPLLLISGTGYTLWEWHRMVPILAVHFRVIAFDNRGMGQSEKPTGPYSADMLAADTAGLLDALGLEKAVICGHSMGGFIAQAMALQYPERVEKLILGATNFGGPHHIPPTPEAVQVLTDVSSDPRTRFKNGLAVSTAPGWAERNPAMVQRWVEWRLANPIEPVPYRAQLAVGSSLLPEAASFEQRLPRLRVATLILSGAQDQVVPPENAALLARQIPDSKVVIFPDAGHFFPIEIPEAASSAIVEFAA